MTTLSFIIGCVLSGLMGLSAGMFAAFYYSRDTYRMTVLRAACNAVARMQQAMRSLGYDQNAIMAVTCRMGDRGMRQQASAPVTEGRALDALLKQDKILAIVKISVHSKDLTACKMAALRYGLELHEAVASDDAGKIDAVAGKIRCAWTGLSKHDYGTLHRRVSIDTWDYDRNGFVRVMFAVVAEEPAEEEEEGL